MVAPSKETITRRKLSGCFNNRCICCNRGFKEDRSFIVFRLVRSAGSQVHFRIFQKLFGRVYMYDENISSLNRYSRYLSRNIRYICLFLSCILITNTSTVPNIANSHFPGSNRNPTINHSKPAVLNMLLRSKLP